ncbi:MAG: hypothetical protein PHR77_03305 [Kiritimatiellae bacterium]|nr:hypothetical protein [Kiritimatiellia bacterium]MDD5519584.1 hypothetical protein [Kiritimatiellia bacterium]
MRALPTKEQIRWFISIGIDEKLLPPARESSPAPQHSFISASHPGSGIPKIRILLSALLLVVCFVLAVVAARRCFL